MSKERVAIKVTLEKEIWVRKNVWEKGFEEQLPHDMEDLEMLQDECTMTNTELKGAEVIGEFKLTK